MNKHIQIIAEIGINHNGDLDTACRLIDVARVAGVDAVKFQKRNPELCVPPDQRDLPKQTPWGEMSYMEYRERMEFGKEEFDFIDGYCRERRMAWFASVWDLDSLRFILEYDPPHIKIPSAMLTNHELLRQTAESGVHTYISSGMSTLDEIDDAVGIFASAGCPFTLMHCNSSYPAQNEELNLACMDTFRERYGCAIGYSGHEFGLIPTVIAAARGAVAVERHITLKRTMPGSDHMASVEPTGLIRLVNYIRAIPEVVGDGVKRLYDSELAARDKLRYVHEDSGGSRWDPVHVASGPVRACRASD
jgi:N-acetylneuraminate synthase